MCASGLYLFSFVCRIDLRKNSRKNIEAKHLFVLSIYLMCSNLTALQLYSLSVRSLFLKFYSDCLVSFGNLFAKWRLLYLVFGFLLFGFGSYADAPSRHFDVFYGGFSIAGNASDFKALFPHINRLSQEKNAKGRNAFQEKFREVFKDGAGEGGNFSLRFEKVGDEAGNQKVFAFAFTDERVSVEKVGGSYKCCINLGADLLILDFESMKVVGCEPIIWEIIDTFEEKPTEQEIDDLLIRLMNSEEYFSQPLASSFSKLFVRDFSRSSIGLVNVIVEEEALSLLPEMQREHLEGYKRWMANQYKSFLSSELNVAVLPYGEKGGAVSIKMAGRFKNTERLSFMIDPPSYGINLSLIRFKRVLQKESASERMLIYGAYIRLQVQNSKFDEVIKKGLPKIVPQSMSNEEIDDFAAYQEVLKNLFLKSTKTMLENKKFKKKVLKKCERK